MSQRDLVAELRAAHVEAPFEVRERVRLIAAAAPAPSRRFTWRRALVVAVPVAAAVAAAIVFTRPSSQPSATETVVDHAFARSAAQPKAAPETSAGAALAVPSPKARVTFVGTSLSLRTRDVSDGVKRAVAIATSLGGYAASVHAETQGHTAVADLTLKVPRGHVQTAMSRLSRLGTILAENVDVTDKTSSVNATDRLISRLQRQLAALRAANAPDTQIAALTARIERLQRSEAATRRAAHYATISLHLETPSAKAPVKHGHGPLHGVGVALKWLGIGAVYALAIGAPVVVLLALVWFAVRLVRRRRVDALLSRS